MKLVTQIKRARTLLVIYFLMIIVSFGLGFKLSAMDRQLSYYRKVMDDLELISQISMSQEKTKPELLTEFKTRDIRVANLKYFCEDGRPI